MKSLPLRHWHEQLGAVFRNEGGEEIVGHYQSTEAEYLNLTRSAAILDFSYRGRLCLLGADREKFLHGQVTNDVLKLKTGEGCYAAVVSGKGKIQADPFIYKLAEELLLDFEPGLTEKITRRFESHIIADDVQVVDVSPHYGLLSIQGPSAKNLVQNSSIFPELPAAYLAWESTKTESGELYVMRNPRLNSSPSSGSATAETDGYDLFVPTELLEAIAKKLSGPWAGLNAFEIARIESAIPRFGVDMTKDNLAPETGIATRAISYAKGCYIGQEVIARIRTYGKVAKALRLIRLPNELEALPPSGEKLFFEGREVGYITSSTLSPKHGGKVALAYVRKECNTPGTRLMLSGNSQEAEIIATPGGS
jgi:folate-binding protein YgfZ